MLSVINNQNTIIAKRKLRRHKEQSGDIFDNAQLLWC